MKAEFFVVGFCIVFAGAWFTYAKHTGGLSFAGHTANEQNIIIRSDNEYEEIKYTGKITFNEPETGIEYISPGGYIKYTRNGQTLEVKPDTANILKYTFSANGRPQPFDSNGQKILVEAVHEMIAWGYGAGERAERIYKKGGSAALLEAMGQLKNDGLKKMYAQKLFARDTPATADLVLLAGKLAAKNGNDYDKEQILRLYKIQQLADTSVFLAYLQAVSSMDNDNTRVDAVKRLLSLPLSSATFPALFTAVNNISEDYQKSDMLAAIIAKGQMDSSRASLLLQAIDQLQPEPLRQQLLNQWINKGTLPASHLNTALAVVGKLNGDFEKAALYKKLAGESVHSEEQWISLIGETVHISENNQKATLLTELAQRMPKTDSIKTAYAKVARTITTDMEYGRAIRAVN